MSDPESARFTFHGELCNFLGRGDATSVVRAVPVARGPSVKDAIESLGVPHPEVDLILVDRQPVDFSHQVRPGEEVEVYPAGAGPAVSPVTRLQSLPPGELRFALDVNLGKLARRLRLAGFDALYRNDFDDPELAALAAREERVLLTRDRGLLCHRIVQHGYWVRADDPARQIVEVLRRFSLAPAARPLQRCLSCNGRIAPIAKEAVLDRLKPGTRRHYDTFYQCRDCNQVYWKGAHYDAIVRTLSRLEAELRPPVQSRRWS